MGKLFQVVMSLSATVKSGRYVFRIKEYDIRKETGKTIIVKGKTYSEDQRFYKSALLNVVSDFRNDMITNIQFYTMCFPEDLESAKSLIHDEIHNKIQELSNLNNLALDAFKDGVKKI